MPTCQNKAFKRQVSVNLSQKYPQKFNLLQQQNIGLKFLLLSLKNWKMYKDEFHFLIGKTTWNIYVALHDTTCINDIQ